MRILLSLAMLMATATAAIAGECPLLQAQIDKEYGKRFDKTAADVKSMAAEAMALHLSGKHAESVEALTKAEKILGI